MRDSRTFANSEKLFQFLEFVVLATLRGEDPGLKETSIGVGLYQRDPTYDPKRDSIVRTQATRHAAVDVAGFIQTCPKCGRGTGVTFRRAAVQEADDRHRLLRSQCKRPRRYTSANYDEVASSHLPPRPNPVPKRYHIRQQPYVS